MLVATAGLLVCTPGICGSASCDSCGTPCDGSSKSSATGYTYTSVSIIKTD